MKTAKTEAIVIKRKNSNEADRILTIFTKYNGKMTVKAVGVRKITSRRSSHIEPLNHSLISLYKGRNMPLLIEVQTIESFSLIKENLTKVGFAYHICELIDGLCAENQENEAVFLLLHATLMRLSTQDDILATIHEFEIELLTLLGFYKQNKFTNTFNTSAFIENILERKLKTKSILHKLS